MRLIFSLVLLMTSSAAFANSPYDRVTVTAIHNPAGITYIPAPEKQLNHNVKDSGPFDFSDDKKWGQTASVIIALIDEHAFLFGIPSEKKQNRMRTLFPFGLFPLDSKTGVSGARYATKLFTDPNTKDASLRLQQIVKVAGRRGLSIPMEGAQVVAVVKNGYLKTLDFALEPSPQLPDPLPKALEDTLSLADGVEKSRLESFFSEIREDPRLKEPRLVFIKNKSARWVLSWRVEAPLGMPFVFYFKATADGDSIDNLEELTLLLKKEPLVQKSTVMNVFSGKDPFGSSEDQIPILESIDPLNWNGGLDTIADRYPESQQSIMQLNDPEKAAINNMALAVAYFAEEYSWKMPWNFKLYVEVTSPAYNANAAWVGEPFYKFLLGAGDGENVTNIPFALDVIGHELCHAFINATANLQKVSRPGALAEHLCDSIGIGFEAYAKSETFDFEFAEEMLQGKPARHFLDSTYVSFLDQDEPPITTMKDPRVNEHYGSSCAPFPGNDECGVHKLNTVLNLALGPVIKEHGWETIKPVIEKTIKFRLRETSHFEHYRQQLLIECSEYYESSTSSSACRDLKLAFDKAAVSEPNAEAKSVDSGVCAELEPVCIQLKGMGIELTPTCRQCGHQ